MNSRQLSVLSAIALFIMIAAIWIGGMRKPATETSAPLYPSLKGQLAKVTSLKIYKSGDQLALEATRNDAGWSIKDRGGYPADTAKINSLLIAIEGAKVREEKTSNPENYATLGVQDLNSTNATGARVELVGVEPAVKLIVGKSDASVRGSYVRRAGEQQSWLIGEQLSVPTEMESWLKRDLLNIGADRVQEISIQLDSSPRYNIVKSQRADANFDVTPLPKGRELNSVSVANNAAQSLTNLQLDDVRPAAELTGHKTVGQAAFRTFDGVIIEITGYLIDDKHWITAKANFDDALAKRFHLPTTAEKPANADHKEQAAAPDKSADTNSLDALVKKGRDEADALNKQLAPWAYAISPYKYEAIFKPLDQLLKKK